LDGVKAGFADNVIPVFCFNKVLIMERRLRLPSPGRISLTATVAKMASAQRFCIDEPERIRIYPELRQFITENNYRWKDAEEDLFAQTSEGHD
jgi:hypothetical protein